MVHDLDFNVLVHLVRPNATIIDVGANKGQSIRSIKEVLPSSIIHSFELNPEFHDVLPGIAAEYSDVTFYPVGLGRNEGQVTFYVPSACGVRYLEEASMVLEEYEKPWVKERWAQRGEMTLEEFRATICSGDSFNFAPDLLKIDVEGAESEVTEGFKNTIDRYRPILFVENGDWPRIWPILHPLGYRPYMPNKAYNGLIPFEGMRANTFYVAG